MAAGHGRRLLGRLIGASWLREPYRLLGQVPVAGPLSRRLVRQVVPFGTRVWVEVTLADDVQRWLYVDPRYELPYLAGHYEPHIARSLRDGLSAGAVFYDVGAHIGVVSLLGAAFVGRDGSVFSFEADPDNFARLEANVERNGAGSVRPIRSAVWSSSGSVTFRRAPALSSGNRGEVATTAVDDPDRRIDVPAVCLDDFADRHRPPDVVKIDVEGGELEVLRGARRVLERVRPLLVCEIHGPDLLTDVRALLTGLEYAIEPLSPTDAFPTHVVARPRHPAIVPGDRPARR